MSTIDICGICRDDLISDLKTLPCKHVFHAECIDSWTARCNQCPFCRRQVEENKEDVPESDEEEEYSEMEELDLFGDNDWLTDSRRRDYLSEFQMDYYFEYEYDVEESERIVLNFCRYQTMSETFIRNNIDFFLQPRYIALIMDYQDISDDFDMELRTYIIMLS